MTINQIKIDDSLSKKPLNEAYTKSLLDNLKPGEQVKMEGENGSFVFYKNDENGFGVEYNSAGIKFVNNPMTHREMGKVLKPIISHADNFEGKISDDLLIRLKEIFWGNDEKFKLEKLTIEDLLKNISLDNVLSTLAFKKELLKETEHKITEGIVGYLDNATNILGEQILLYHKDSVIKNKILMYNKDSVIKNKILKKWKDLESYKRNISDGKFIEGIQKDISDLENLLDILENQDTKGELAKDIKDLKNRKDKEDSSAEINTFFNQIYAWDAFAIPYAQFSNSSFTYGLDQGTRDFGEVNGWGNGSNEINRLGKKQESLMDDRLSFEQKKEAFQEANQEYLDSIGFLLGTGCNALPSEIKYYEGIKNQIEIDDFISMPCSDIYPAVLQKVILPFYLKDLYQEVCDLLGKKSLEKSINQYISELRNTSGLAKLSAVFSNNENKVKSLESIVEKIQSLRSKLSSLERQINDFQNKKKDELVKIASEFCVIEEFIRIDNTNICPSFTMADQDKWLYFMRNN